MAASELEKELDEVLFATNKCELVGNLSELDTHNYDRIIKKIQEEITNTSAEIGTLSESLV